MKSQVGPSALNLATKEALEKFLGDSDISVVGFFEDKSKLHDQFIKVADKLREKFRFGVTTAQANIGEFK